MYFRQKDGILRLRIQGKSLLVTTKLNTYNEDISWKEKEFKLNKLDFNLVEKLVEIAFFKKICEIHKTRVEYKYEEFNIDSIKELGNFIEVELLLNDKEEISAGKRKIISLFNKLGISKSDIINRGYVKLLEGK